MKLLFAGKTAMIAIAALLAVFPGSAQSTTSTTQSTAPSTQEQPAQQSAEPHGKVLFQRSLDANGNTVSTTGPAAKPEAAVSGRSTATDVERQSVAITNLDLDVRLNSLEHQIAARAQVTVRNTGKAPIARIPLQISSSLTWERIRVSGRDVPLAVATIDSDVDHTGQLHEAAVPLAEPLAPGATVQLDATYSGPIVPNARRLLSVGTPEDSAAHSDWDTIGPEFTGLRGFGNAAWYPVASTPVMIGEGARLFDEIGRQKLGSEGTGFRLRLTLEFPHGQPPTVAVVNGNALKLAVNDSESTSPDVPGIATGDTGPTTLSFESPSLFVSTAMAHAGTHATAYSGPEDEASVKDWLNAAGSVSPTIERWLGTEPRTQLILLDLPDPEDNPWESGPLLAIPLRPGAPEEIESVLAHALTHAWMAPSPYWLNEGAANFMGAVWLDQKQQHDKALASLESGRQALSLEEPSSPGAKAGQSLATATSPVYYRTKSAYVLWMLRDQVGDDALAAALRASNSAPAGAVVTDKSAAQLSAFQSALKTAAPRADLSWLFADWIDADHGLPDLTIDKVFPNAVQSGNWLVSVTISNAGYAAAEIPVTVRSATNTTTEHVLVPARGTVTPRLLVQGQPIEAQVNDGSVPETQASVHVMRLDRPVSDQTLSNPPQQ
jgi:hypothetical protein